MEQEQRPQLKMLFLLGYNLKIVWLLVGEEQKFGEWGVYRSGIFLNGGREGVSKFSAGGGGGGDSAHPPIRENPGYFFLFLNVFYIKPALRFYLLGIWWHSIFSLFDIWKNIRGNLPAGIFQRNSLRGIYLFIYSFIYLLLTTLDG